MPAPKGHEKVIVNYLMETSAEQIVAELKEHGVRARYKRCSRSIDEEPFVEHSYDVIVGFVHIDEWHCAVRILRKASFM